MRIIGIIISCLLISFGCSNSFNKATCIFSKEKISCDDYSECEKILQNQKNIDQRNALIANLISQKNFSILIDNIESGDSCAIRLGFHMFEFALERSEAEYMEELSISLSYSIENNPTKFLLYLPDSFIERNEIITSLSCGVYPDYRENKEYIKKHPNNRLTAINSVEKTNLKLKRNIVGNSIINNVKEFE